jgi:hypothetical protein
MALICFGVNTKSMPNARPETFVPPPRPQPRRIERHLNELASRQHRGRIDACLDGARAPIQHELHVRGLRIELADEQRHSSRRFESQRTADAVAPRTAVNTRLTGSAPFGPLSISVSVVRLLVGGRIARGANLAVARGSGLCSGQWDGGKRKNDRR